MSLFAVRTCSPSDTSSRTARISTASASSIAPSSTSGYAVRCTLWGCDTGHGPRTRFWYISSAKKGVNGAVSFATATSTS